ncbi:myosin heavy chain, clone 203-like [Bombus flavifrons]|uniref:myosin heavy chain, clone 203-like n=1 Tax=Bombus flavifrons TaxID=103934 RepID=UPI003703AB8A
MSKGKACTGRDEQSTEMPSQVQEELTQIHRRIDLSIQRTDEESKQRDKEIEFLRKTIAEIKLRIQKTIKEPTSWSYQGRLVSNNLNKSLEKKEVTVENEEMVLKEFSKELQSNVENSYEKKIPKELLKLMDTVQNIKFTKGRSHTQNDMEDVVEDSRELSNESKLSKIRIALNKIEDTKTILQNKKNSLEGEKEVGEKKKVSSSKVKSRGLITANDQKLNYDPEHQLTDLQVECSNKDRTTRGHEGGSVKIGIATRTNNKTRRNNISHKYEVDLLEQEKVKLNSCVSNLIEERDKLELKLQKRQNVVLEPQGQIMCPTMEKHQEELDDIIKLHDEEKYKLIQYWRSVECQTAIKAYIGGKVQ